MITRETPITEVIQFLPKGLAQIMDDQPWDVQMAALYTLRDIIAAWERRGIVLDPITYEGILFDVGVQIVAIYMAANELEAQQ